MDNQKLLLALLATVNGLIIYQVIRNRRQRTKRLWTKNWLRRRSQGRGTLALLNNELLLEDPLAYRNFLRMDEPHFARLLMMIEPEIAKQTILMRDTISPRHRLNITLRFLATGESYRSLMYSMRVHESTISLIVPEVCAAIYNVLKTDYLKVPKTPEDWDEIARHYKNRWNFPNCIGALDGRHIAFRAPTASGSYYYNYKNTHSIVLLALVDAHYQFKYANVGVNGRISDGGVFNESKLCGALQRNTLGLPRPVCLPGRRRSVPFVIIADDAFPLLPNIMKPFPQRDLNHPKRIFNYRLSRARRMVESAFGILANRWRVLLTPINLTPDKVEKITLACLCLHNFLAKENYVRYVEENVGEPRLFEDNLRQVGLQGPNTSSADARQIREEFMVYFNSPLGAVGWQEAAIERGNY